MTSRTLADGGYITPDKVPKGTNPNDDKEGEYVIPEGKFGYIRGMVQIPYDIDQKKLTEAEREILAKLKEHHKETLDKLKEDD